MVLCNKNNVQKVWFYKNTFQAKDYVGLGSKPRHGCKISEICVAKTMIFTTGTRQNKQRAQLLYML